MPHEHDEDCPFCSKELEGRIAYLEQYKNAVTEKQIIVMQDRISRIENKVFPLQEVPQEPRELIIPFRQIKNVFNGNPYIIWVQGFGELIITKREKEDRA